MNLTINDPLIQIPAAAASFLAGAALGGIFYGALHTTTEIFLIKNFGDYDHPKKLNEKVVITIDNKYFYYATPMVVAAVAAAISSIVYPILIANGCPSLMATSAAIGFFALPIIAALLNFYNHYIGRCQRHYVMINNDEAKERGIDLKNLEEIKHHGKLYIKFGKPPVYTRHYKG